MGLKSFRIRGLLLLLAGAVIGFSLAVGGGVLAGLAPSGTESASLPWSETHLLAEVLERVRHDYVEPVSDHQLMENAIRGMVTELDPHSQFLTSDEYEEIRISTSGNYSGIGLEVHMENGRVSIVAPIDGSPAARAGLRSGDVLLTIDGLPANERSVNDAILRLRGKNGSHVVLTVGRKGISQPMTFDLVRNNVRVKSVRSALLEPGIGYVRISQFSETTAGDMRKAIADLQRAQPAGLTGLVLDMRNNPGGVVDAAVDVADAFLNEGIIVTASGRTPEATFRYDAHAGDVLDGGHLVVLVNAGSASASEIVAGALHDHHRATIVGQRTFGKGSVQTVMPLSDGRAIKLTTSRYFTPSGASIQGQGIAPDVAFNDGDGETPQDSASASEHAGPKDLLHDDLQVLQALSIVKGKEMLQTRTD